MQNEFEKQVQQKMDELRFVPTPPVWEKIEAQIRKKKERRRLFIWLPVLLLLCGGGMWQLLYVRHQSSVASVITPSIEKSRSSAIKEQTQSSLNGPQAKQGSVSKNITSKIYSNNNSINTTPVEIRVKDSETNPSHHTKFIKGLSAHNAFIGEPSEPFASDNAGSIPLDQVREQSRFPLMIVPVTASVDSSAKNRRSIVSIPDSAVALAQPVKKGGPPKAWRFGFSAAGGWSGLSNNNLLSLNKNTDFGPSYTAASLPRSPLVNEPSPSPIKDYTALELGVVAERQLSQKVSVSTGLQYNYLSTVVGVGKKLSQTATTASNLSGSVYYVNVGHGQYYVNRFHFISLPVSVEARLLKRLPILVRAGFSVRRLLSASALQYDYVSQVYYRDEHTFRKTQLFSTIGLDYAFKGKRSSWRAGPQLSYGLTPMDANRTSHWYSAGLRVQYLLGK